MSEALTPETAGVEMVMSLAELRALLRMVDVLQKRAEAWTMHALECEAARTEWSTDPGDLQGLLRGVEPLTFLVDAEAQCTSKLYEANSRG